MFPLGHLAVGYLLYLGYRRVRKQAAPPSLVVLLVLAIGTQFPDLIDKPLAHWGVLVSGRSLGHSLLFVVPLWGGVRKLTTHLQRQELGDAFIIGVLSHLLADSYQALLRGDWVGLGHLLYPITRPVDYPDDDISLLFRTVRYYANPELNAESAVILLAFIFLAWQVWRSFRVSLLFPPER